MAKFHSPNAGSGAANNGGGGADSGKIRAAHLLVKHNQSRRPMSWKEVRGPGDRPCCPSSVAIVDALACAKEDRCTSHAVLLAGASGLVLAHGD